MDVRHQSFKEALINQIITIINKYINENIDSLLKNESLQSEIKYICKHIYDYLNIPVDIDGILSKHNLLSIDVVMLPLVTDPEANRILNNGDFKKLINEIKLTLINQKNIKETAHNSFIRKNILNLFNENQL
jgi:hypothetical protein